MNGERYVVAALAHPRSPWFAAVGSWATSAAIPVELVKCVSGEELRARLTSTRRFSAVLLDGGLVAVDRDLLAAVSDARCAAIVVSDPRVHRDWEALGASATLLPGFDRPELLDALSAVALLIPRAERPVVQGAVDDRALPPGAVVTVTGPGGTGASTMAIALAQGLARDERFGGSVVLGDLCRHAEQAMLHDTIELHPGLQELVDAHRHGMPSPDDVKAMTFHIQARGYDLLAGLRRPRFWTSLRRAPFGAAMTGLASAYDIVVLDCDADVEGENTSGSMDVEDRNLAARTAHRQADLVLVVGHPSMKGLHSLARCLHDLVELGVAGDRLVPVFNHMPRSPRLRAGYSRALAELAGWRSSTSPNPVFVPTRPVDDALRSNLRIAGSMCGPLTSAVLATLRRVSVGVVSTPVLVGASAGGARMTPGSLGSLLELGEFDDDSGGGSDGPDGPGPGPGTGR
jgi:cellulose biosynthesis protein BcsQ